MRMIVLIAAVMTLTMTSVQAQGIGGMGGMGGMGSGGRHHGQQQKKAKTDTTPKANEKAYNAALKGIPNKPYDPWHGVH